MVDENLRDEIQSLEHLINESKYKLDKLKQQDDEEFQLDARVNVGRCFKRGDTYVKIIDVPQLELIGYRSMINRYQYPAIYISHDDENEVSFFFDVFHSRNFHNDAPPIGNKGPYEEISLEEFNAVFNTELDNFRDRILTIRID